MIPIVSERLIDLRKEKGISRKRAVKEIRIAYRSLERYEKQLCLPNCETLVLLADYYGVTTDRLLGRD